MGRTIRGDSDDLTAADRKIIFFPARPHRTDCPWPLKPCRWRDAVDWGLNRIEYHFWIKLKHLQAKDSHPPGISDLCQKRIGAIMHLSLRIQIPPSQVWLHDLFHDLSL